MKTIIQQRGLDMIDPYVPGKPIEEVQREYGIKDVIKLASNENPLGPSPLAKKALFKAIDLINYYPDGECFNLSKAVAEYFLIEQNRVYIDNGADGVIESFCLAYLDEYSEVIVSQSSFPVYDIYTHVMRAKLIKTPLKNFGLDLSAMAAAITDHTKLIFVCNPNNPTGTIVTAMEIEDFMAHVPDHVLVIFDEAYYDFVDDTNYPDTMNYVKKGIQNVVTMRTFSKVYGLAGLRIGYAFGVPDILAPLNVIRGTFAVNLLAQVAGIVALQDKEFLARSVKENDKNRKFLYQEFNRLGLPFVKSHTNFILVKFGTKALEIYQKLLQRGIIVRPGKGYILPEYLRITIGSESQNTRLIAELEKVI